MHVTHGGVTLDRIERMTWAELVEWWQHANRLFDRLNNVDDEENTNDG